MSDAGYEVELLINNDFQAPNKVFDLLILDLSDRDDSPSEAIIGGYGSVVAFDWSRKLVPDINFVVFLHEGRNYPSRIETFVGLKYIVLDRSFSSMKVESNAPVDKYQLISIGFSPKSEKISEVIDEATKISDLPIKICTGVELNLDIRENVEVLKDPIDYAQLVMNSEIIYTNGASTLVEAMLLRKQIIAFPQNIDEEFFLTGIEKQLGVNFRIGKYSNIFTQYDPGNLFDANGGLRILEVLRKHLL
jgi:hypothetical protein